MNRTSWLSSNLSLRGFALVIRCKRFSAILREITVHHATFRGV
jgi:hypothetical protein